MNDRIQFLDDLRAELMTAPAPAPVRRPQPGRPRPRPGWLVAAAAFVAVIAVGLGVAWLASLAVEVEPGGPELVGWEVSVRIDGSADAEAVVERIRDLAEVTDVRLVRDGPALGAAPPARLADDQTATTTVPGATPDRPERGEPSAAFIWVRDGDDPEAVAAELFGWNEITGVGFSESVAKTRADRYHDLTAAEAAALGTDPAVVRPQPSAQPPLDVTSFGEEVELRPVRDVADIPAVLWEALDGSDVALDEGRPVLAIGHVEDGPHLLVYPTTDDGYCAAVVRESSVGTSCGSFATYGFGIEALSARDGAAAYVVVRVPLETVAVVVTADGAPPRWQRPVAGWALVPLPGESVDLTVEGFDADGLLTVRARRST